MMRHGLQRLADRFAKAKDVIGRDGDPYLTRWVLAGERFVHTWHDCAVFLHRFHRSDHDYPHNHPWPFVSVILAGGYWEHTLAGYVDPATGRPAMARKWHRPGSVLRRPASWFHRVELEPGVDSWSLVFRGRKVQSWGFLCPGAFVPWREYLSRYDAGVAVCE